MAQTWGAVILFLLALVCLGLQPLCLAGSAMATGKLAIVNSSQEFAEALVDTQVTEIQLSQDVQLDAGLWSSFYSRDSPFILTHNLTITSGPLLNRLDFAWTGDGRVLLAPGVFLNISGLVLQHSRYGPGVQLDFLAYSPGAYLVLWNSVIVKVACVSYSKEPDAVAVQPRLPGFPGEQSARYVGPYCLLGTCYNNVLVYDDYTKLSAQTTEDTATGGYAMVMRNFTKICLNFLGSSSCSGSDSMDVCLKAALDRYNIGPPYTPRQIAAAAAAAAAQQQQRGTALIAGLVAGLVGGVLLLLGIVALLLWRRRSGRLRQQRQQQQQKNLSLPVAALPGDRGSHGSDPLPPTPGVLRQIVDTTSQAKTAAAAAAAGGGTGSNGTSNSSSSWELAAFKTSERFLLVPQQQQQPQQQQHFRRHSSGELMHVVSPPTPSAYANWAAASAVRSPVSGSTVSPTFFTAGGQDLLGATAISSTDRISLGVLLGAGSFGRVFKGRWRGLDVAVKVLQHRREATASVANEVNLMMSFQHPNIVAAHHFVTWRKRQVKHKPSDAPEEGGEGTMQQPTLIGTSAPGPDAEGLGPTGEYHEDTQTWIVQELCDAGNLGEYVLGMRQKHPGQLPEAHDMLRLLFRLREVAEGMDYLHEASVVHGDLKSGNVLLSVSPTSAYGRIAKITDFGLSRALGTNQTHRSTHTLGTVSHMAPELLRFGKMSTAVDVYSFGIMMWELLTCRVPWQGLHYGSIIERVALMGERPSVPAGTPEDFELLMCSCWQTNPQQRPEFDQVIRCLDIMIASRQQELAEVQYASSTMNSQLQASAATAAGGTGAAAGTGATGTATSVASKPHSSAAEPQDLDSGPAASTAVSRTGMSGGANSSSRSHLASSVAVGPAAVTNSGSRQHRPAPAATNEVWMAGPHGPQDL